jgi:hypothetical protein
MRLGRRKIVTIYSQHPNRGKVQILATYQGRDGVTSTTVTSVDGQAVAGPIVDALNRVSAYATVPVSANDRRDDRYRRYPSDHIEALVNRDARPELRVGTHSLWYQHVMLRLAQALSDLDDAVAAAPPPVRTAIAAELELEARGLREGLAEFSEGVTPPESGARRLWDSDAPFVTSEEALSDEDRGYLNEREQGVSAAELCQGVADLQVLFDVLLQCTNDSARLHVDEFSIADDPWGDVRDNFFLDVSAPIPSGDFGQESWSVGISRWVPDDPDEEFGSASSDALLECGRSTPPGVDEIVNLLNLSAGNNDQLAAWAKTAVGEPLAGTNFIVTTRHSD